VPLVALGFLGAHVVGNEADPLTLSESLNSMGPGNGQAEGKIAKKVPSDGAFMKRWPRGGRGFASISQSIQRHTCHVAIPRGARSIPSASLYVFEYLFCAGTF
jgi:hypothetical protein